MPPKVAIIGAGHNGLVCAAYLARAGVRVQVLERRSVLGGSSVTEECWPGYRVSRAAYVLGLFRPDIVRELELPRHGLRLLPRSPSSFTPLPDGRALVLGSDIEANLAEIRRFSIRDAQMYPRYEMFLERIARAVEPLLDLPPPEFEWTWRGLTPWWRAAGAALSLGRALPSAAALLLGAAKPVLEEWFDSEPLRATLGTDAIIGAFAAPSSPGTGYVLFHHVMGSVSGHRGVWAYVQGGMGGLAESLAGAARAAGATIRADAEVAKVRIERGRATGVELRSGEIVAADFVISSADPARTFLGLVDEGALPADVVRAVRALDFRSPVVKVNLALRRLPEFRLRDREAPPLTGTIHIGSETLDSIERAFAEAQAGDVSSRPVVELTIPSVLDSTLAPEGRHVASIFAQYAPARPLDDPEWPALRERARDRILAVVEEVAPGFTDSIEHIEVLTPPDLERIFALTGGNIFHGAMTPDRLFSLRPLPGWTGYRTPVSGLYLCGAGTHPGGGVIGSCGRNAAREVLRDTAGSSGLLSST